MVKSEILDCGDNSCAFAPRPMKGMRTNGGCRCFRDDERWIEGEWGYGKSILRKFRQFASQSHKRIRDIEAENVCLRTELAEAREDGERLEMAWVVIANATDWDLEHRADWKQAAERWRDDYFANLPSEGPMAEIPVAAMEGVEGEK